MDNEASWNYLQGFFEIYEFKCLRNSNENVNKNKLKFSEF